MHASRRQALFKATEALLQGRRLTLMDLARSWPDAQRVRAPLKALDRLLGNRHLQGERFSLHAAMAVWLLRQKQPVIVVDWCDLKADRSQHLLRAAIAVAVMASPQLKALSARQLIGLYARRMQIELAFRDLKSHRYGQGFEDSLTRKGSRIEILLLIQTLAAFVSWLVGIACEKVGIDRWLNPRRSIRRLYSVMRLGREALMRRWLNWAVEQLVAQLLDPHSALREQLELPA